MCFGHRREVPQGMSKEQDRSGGWGWHEASGAELARGMRWDADDATFAAAWREFEHRHLAHISSFIESRAGGAGPDVCDDLLSEALRRIEKGIDGYVDQGPGKLRSWCFKTAQRAIDDFWRGRLSFEKERTVTGAELVSFDEIEERYGTGLVLDDSTDALAISVASVTPGDGADRLRQGIDSQALYQAFMTLPEVDQAVIWCKMVHGDSDKYVAHITGKPEDHVRKIRGKAVGKLLKRYDRAMATRRQAS